MKRPAPDNLVVLGIAVAAVAGTILLVYLPQGNELDAIQAQSLLRKKELAANIEKASVVPQMVRQIRRMKERYQGFDRRMPQRKELAGFLREISEILASEQLSNQETKPGDPTREELFHTLPIIMKFQGPYLSLTSLLERIDEMERLTRVQKLSISKDWKSQGLDIEVQMNIYFKES